MSALALIEDTLNPRKRQVLRYAEVAMSESQFKAFRGLFLDEFGNGLVRELEAILSKQDWRFTAQGRPTHAGKEVHHE